MSEFEYEVSQKKRLVASARKQKNGCRSRKCSLPSDHLTAAQLRAKNGPVTECNLNEPMDWEAFKAMPVDLQAEYVRNLNSRFDVGLNSISKDLFGKSDATLRLHLLNHGVVISVRGKNRLSRAEYAVWSDWLARKNKCDECVEEAVQEEPQMPEACEPEVKETVTPADFGMSSLCAEWLGEFNALAFMAQLSRLPMPEGRVKIRLEVEKA